MNITDSKNKEPEADKPSKSGKKLLIGAIIIIILLLYKYRSNIKAYFTVTTIKEVDVLVPGDPIYIEVEVPGPTVTVEIQVPSPPVYIDVPVPGPIVYVDVPVPGRDVIQDKFVWDAPPAYKTLDPLVTALGASEPHYSFLILSTILPQVIHSIEHISPVMDDGSTPNYEFIRHLHCFGYNSPSTADNYQPVKKLEFLNDVTVNYSQGDQTLVASTWPIRALVAYPAKVLVPHLLYTRKMMAGALVRSTTYDAGDFSYSKFSGQHFFIDQQLVLEPSEKVVLDFFYSHGFTIAYNPVSGSYTVEMKSYTDAEMYALCNEVHALKTTLGPPPPARSIYSQPSE